MRVGLVLGAGGVLGGAWLVRRPPGPAAAWPDFRELARARWAVAREAG